MALLQRIKQQAVTLRTAMSPLTVRLGQVTNKVKFWLKTLLRRFQYTWWWARYKLSSLRLFRKSSNTAIATTRFDATKFAEISTESEFSEIKPRFSIREYSRKLLKPALFAVVLLPLLLILVSLYQSTVFQSTYTLTFSKDSFSKPSDGFTVNEDPKSYKFGADAMINGVGVPEILSSPIQLAWYPKQFPLGKQLTLNMDIQDQGDWDVSLVCSGCGSATKYNWKPLYRGKLNNYQLVQHFDGYYLYSKSKDVNYNTATNLFDWIKENDVGLDKSFKVYDNAVNPNDYLATSIGYQPNTNTTIGYTLRGPHQFYMYLEDTLKISVDKKDLDYSPNIDDVTVVLSDLAGHTVYQTTIVDDDIRGDDINKSVAFQLDKLPYKGVYLLEFKGNSDWTIKNLVVNTNKIVFKGANLIMDAGSLYTKVNSTSPMRAYIWWESALQSLTLTSGNKTIAYPFNAGDLGFNKYIEVKPGEYTIAFNGVQVLDGYYFAVNKDTYFDPFLMELNVPINGEPDFILSTIPKAGGVNGTRVSVNFDKEEYLKSDSLREVDFVLRNNLLDSRYNRDEIQLSAGYSQSSNFSKYRIWGKQSPLPFDQNLTIQQAISYAFPQNSNVYVSAPVELSQNDYINNDEPAGLKVSETPDNLLSLSLRGSHTFNFFAKTKFIANITKQDLNWYTGADALDITVSDFLGNQVCSISMEDDGNIVDNKQASSATVQLGCDLPKAGIYQLNIKEHVAATEQPKSDFLIKQIQINTNKFVAKGKVLNTLPISLYTNNKSDWQMGLYYWIDGLEQIIRVYTNGTEQDIDLAAEDLNNNKSVPILKGEATIVTSKGNVSVSGLNFAFKAENWFDTYKINLVNDDSQADFKILSYPYLTPSYILGAELSVQ